MARINLEAVITARDNTRKAFDQFSRGLGSIVNPLKKLAFISAGATAAVTAFAYKSIKAYNIQENAVVRLRRGIENVTSATSKNIDVLLKQASALQKVTRFGDEQIISAQAQLATFQLNQEAIKELTPRILDMAEGLRKTTGETVALEDISKVLGRALTMGAGALTRYGVVLTETQRKEYDQAEGMEKIRILTEILDQNYKGLAEAAGDTAAGAIDRLRNAFGDLMEQIGGLLAEALEPFIRKLAEWAESDETADKIKEISDKVKKLTDDMIRWSEQVGIPWVRQHWPQIRDIVIKTASAIAGFVKWLWASRQAIRVLLPFIGFLVAQFNPFLGVVLVVSSTIWNMYSAIKSVIGAIKELWEATVWINRAATMRFKRLFGFQAGGIVPYTGLHLLHAGEVVRPQGSFVQSGGTTINIYGNINNSEGLTIEEIEERLARKLELSQQGAY